MGPWVVVLYIRGIEGVTIEGFKGSFNERTMYALQVLYHRRTLRMDEGLYA